MRLVLMHVDNPDRFGRLSYGEEAAFVIPGGEKTALLVPFEALEHTVPILVEALEDLPEQCCDACGESLAVVPEHRAPLD
jgi:hypothetical protein